MLGVSIPEALLFGSALGLGAFAVRSQIEDVTTVRASDGRDYLVQNYPDRREAAEVLARLRAKLVAFIAYASSGGGAPPERYASSGGGAPPAEGKNATGPNVERFVVVDPRILLLKNNWNSDTINEGSNHSTYTSFTTDKRDITMCLRSSTTNRLEPEPLLMFVLLHEAAHCATEVSDNPLEDPHTSTFWANFKFILQVAVAGGFYVNQDFRARPVKFCGVDVTDSPLH